jgi:hypothetical protein
MHRTAEPNNEGRACTLLGQLRKKTKCLAVQSALEQYGLCVCVCVCVFVCVLLGLRGRGKSRGGVRNWFSALCLYVLPAGMPPNKTWQKVCEEGEGGVRHCEDAYGGREGAHGKTG